LSSLLLLSFPPFFNTRMGLKKTLQDALHKVTKRSKNEKSKDEGKHKAPPTPVNSHSNPNERTTVGRKLEERTQPDIDGTAIAHALNGKTPKAASVPQSPNIPSPSIASPAGSCERMSCERMDDSKGERDQSEGGTTAKSIKGDGGITDHYHQFLEHIASKGWQKVADEFKMGYRTNAEVNRTTRYVISFNVPPDGDFYDANRVDFPSVYPKFYLAAVPDSSVTSKETFWRMIYDAQPSLVFF
ncbi:hypothetical protein PENTCL1PPCAC_2130, partial [Pristionchus entomophagus]